MHMHAHTHTMHTNAFAVHDLGDENSRIFWSCDYPILRMHAWLRAIPCVGGFFYKVASSRRQFTQFFCQLGL